MPASFSHSHRPISSTAAAAAASHCVGSSRIAAMATGAMISAASTRVLVMGWRSRWPVRRSGRWSTRHDARGWHRRPAPAAAVRHRSPATGPR
ncbi:hypothetical protein G6F24_017926 [Rhizopus arrhizus]|nr:hypothetical protein G6F24_017926 [Rhizopus arrhizus]